MDIVQLNSRALDQAVPLVEQVSRTQMRDPTPCADWDVRALLTHMVGGNLRWAGLPAGGSLTRAPATGTDLLGDDPGAAYRRSATELAAAWRDPALLDREFALPVGVLPGRAALVIRLIETVTHAWDLAMATGQQPAFDDTIIEAALAGAQASMPRERPPGMPFAPPVTVGDERPAIDRLVAFLGRTPPQ